MELTVNKQKKDESILKIDEATTTPTTTPPPNTAQNCRSVRRATQKQFVAFKQLSRYCIVNLDNSYVAAGNIDFYEDYRKLYYPREKLYFIEKYLIDKELRYLIKNYLI